MSRLQISVTEGVVSRIEVQPYSHSLKIALAVTVDAAINSGNSGGPVMNQKGELVGIAFQALEGAEAIGHIVPPVVIKHFLHGIERFGDKYQVISLSHN
jgi:S1-C subfamily serine protease